MQVIQKQSKNPVPPQFVGKNFQPGKSGNPGGLVKYGRIDAVIREELGKVDKQTGKQYKHLIVQTMRDLALGRQTKGNVTAATWLADRGWGKPKETIDLNAAMEQKISVEAIRSVLIDARVAGDRRTTGT